MNPRYALILTAKPSDVPAIIRLRRLLKLALRGFAMECIEVKEIPATAPQTAPHCTPCNGISLENTNSSIPEWTKEGKTHE